MFDRLQWTHLAEARNIADPEVVLGAARGLSLEAAAFGDALEDPATLRAVETDRQRARAHRIRSIPALIVRDTGPVSSTDRARIWPRNCAPASALSP